MEIATGGVWGRSRQPLEANGGLEAEPPTLRRILLFFFKNKEFLSIFWSKFLLEKVFLNNCKACC